MERVVVQTVVEGGRHPGALYWGVVSVAAVCSVWGTLALAKRSKGERRQGVMGVHAFKRLRRLYATNLRPLLEDLVYLTMFVINLLVGVFYWIVDFVVEGRSRVSSEEIVVSSILSRCVDSDDLRAVDDAEALRESAVLHRPRRGQIKRLRTRWAWARSESKPSTRQRCECWGWRVEDLVPEENLGGNGSEIQSKQVDVGPAGQILQDGDGVSIPPRWTECHCDHCAPLLMPMRMAARGLHVITEESFKAKKHLSPCPPTASNVVDECSSDDLGIKKERTAVIFIHGLFSSATFWFDTDIASNLSDEVKKQHPILAPDLLGVGRSPRPVDGFYTLADQVEAIEKSVIQRHKLESFHLVGHSMGSIIALALAARCPQRVRSITLIAPVYPPCCLREDGELAQIPCDAFFSSLDPLTIKGVRALTVCKYYNISRLLAHLFYAKHTFWVDRVHGLLKSKGYPRSFIHDYLTVYHDAAWHIAHNTLLAGTHAVIPALKTLRDSGHQILVIHGEIDTTIQFRLAEEMSRTFSNVELVGVPEKGHVDVVWGRAKENASLIEKAIRDGDNRWSRS
ncbi:hypothetical protein KC19_8G072000 [Ceratodon purpureus]|uniref:AB hydrolase-1 domain-containing protein n=1 Tax=Ceratodon purpureus TaxID=3225 RepID=A0A8T0GWB1_CERPU|nr:hypothetical protein KC19_8G072000 [Ceratodon purpureus]